MTTNALKLVVDLYRLAGRPALRESSFFDGVVDYDRCSGLVRQILQNVRDHYGRFELLEIDGRTIVPTDVFPNEGSTINFSWKLATSDGCRFYSNIEALIGSSRSIGKGSIPSNFYLVDNDYFYDDQPFPKDIETIYVACEAISFLSRIAQHHDEKTSSGNFNLVFIHASSDNSTSTTCIETKITKDIVNLTKPDISLLRELCASIENPDLHSSEKRSIFRSTLAEFMLEIRGEKDQFIALLREWEKFVSKFRRNLDVYLSGFSFSKARNAVAEAELTIAEKHAKVVSDITGKLLGLPLSLVAVAGVISTDSVALSTIYVMGALLVSVIMSGAIKSQQHQVDRITETQNLVFQSLNDKSDTYPKDLQNALNHAVKGLEADQRFLKKILRCFRVISWLPPIVALVFHGYFFI